MAKIKLAITQVKEVQKIGDKGVEKLAFKAKDFEGKELWYFTFAKSLFPAIKDNVGKEIEADVETTNREVDGNVYTDRKVTQLYVGGEAVAAKGQPPKQGFQGYRDNPESRASIELQTAFKGIIELMVAGVVAKDDPLGKAAITWALSKFGVKETQPAPEKKKPAKSSKQTEKANLAEVAKIIVSANTSQAQLPKEPEKITEDQRETINDLAARDNVIDEVKAYMIGHYHKANTTLFTKAEASELIGLITKGEIKKIEKGG